MSRAEGSPGTRAVVLALVVAVEVVVFGLETGGFVSLTNFAEIVRRTTELALPALALTAVLAGGAVDLSLGGTMALAAAVLGASTRPGGLPLAGGAVLALAAGALAGALNAAAVARLRASPLLVTFATGWLYRGIAEALVQAKSHGAFPPAFVALGQKYVLADTMPAQLPLVAVVAALYWWLLRRARPLALLYVLGGAVTAVAALAQVARTNEVSTVASRGLDAFTLVTAVIGGASLTGGRGGVAGTLLAALAAVTLMNALALEKLAPDIAVGVVAVAALAWAWAARVVADRRAASGAGGPRIP